MDAERNKQMDELIAEVKALRAATERRSAAPPKAVDKAEAARLIGVSMSTLERMARNGELPCVRFRSGTIRFRMQDIEALLERQLQDTTHNDNGSKILASLRG